MPFFFFYQTKNAITSKVSHCETFLELFTESYIAPEPTLQPTPRFADIQFECCKSIDTEFISGREIAENAFLSLLP